LAANAMTDNTATKNLTDDGLAEENHEILSKNTNIHKGGDSEKPKKKSGCPVYPKFLSSLSFVTGDFLGTVYPTKMPTIPNNNRLAPLQIHTFSHIGGHRRLLDLGF
jgi:hypothetical protein